MEGDTSVWRRLPDAEGINANSDGARTSAASATYCSAAIADTTRAPPVNTFTRFYPQFYLAANGLLYAVLTALFLIAPRVWFANLGIELVDELGYTELKAMYIGMMGTLALFSLLGAAQERFLDPALVLSLASYAALASVRSWGILVEGIFDSFTLQLLYAELSCAAAAAVALIARRNAAA